MIPFSKLWKGNSAPPTSPSAAQPAAPTSPKSQALTVGSTIGRCVLLRQLGEGACGRVFQAHHKTLNISVALKLLQPALFHDRKVHDQIKHEAQLLARLNHPHIVRVWDFEDDPACPYIMMEYINGPTLADLIEQSGRLAPERRSATATSCGSRTERRLETRHYSSRFEAGKYPAHAKRRGQASDLGLAVVLGSSPDVNRPVAAGTPLYAAPEQCYSPEKVDQRSDIYSLGSTFYHALTGEPPFTGTSVGEVMHRHACEMAIPPHHRVSGVPPALSAIVLRMLAKDPDYRFSDYEQLLFALDKLANEADPERKRATRPELRRE